MPTYEERLEFHRKERERKLSNPDMNWVSKIEAERFSPEQLAESDMLLYSIGIDPDVYLDYARAQVVRTHENVRIS